MHNKTIKNYYIKFINLLKKLAYALLGLFILGLLLTLFCIMFKSSNENLTYSSYITIYTFYIKNSSEVLEYYATNSKQLFEHFSDEDLLCLFGALPSYMYILSGYASNNIDKLPDTLYLKKSGSNSSSNEELEEDNDQEENTTDTVKKENKGKNKAVDSDPSSPANLYNNAASHNSEEENYIKQQQEYDAKFAEELQRKGYDEDLYGDILSNIEQVESDSDSYSVLSSDIHSEDSPDIKRRKQALKDQDEYLRAEKVVLDDEALELENKTISEVESIDKAVNEPIDKPANESTDKTVNEYDDIVEEMLTKSREYARIKSTSPPISGPHGEASGTQHQSYAAAVAQRESSSTNKRERDPDPDLNNPNKKPKKE